MRPLEARVYKYEVINWFSKTYLFFLISVAFTRRIFGIFCTFSTCIYITQSLSSNSETQEVHWKQECYYGTERINQTRSSYRFLSKLFQQSLRKIETQIKIAILHYDSMNFPFVYKEVRETHILYIFTSFCTWFRVCSVILQKNDDEILSKNTFCGSLKRKIWGFHFKNVSPSAWGQY